MKSLYNYILEARGVVTDENSWSRVSKLVIHKLKLIKSGEPIVINSPQYLPPWMNSLTIELKDNSTQQNAFAMYDDEKSKVVDGKMDCWVVVYGTNQPINNIEHELQHGFDDWIARTKRGMKNEMTDKYCIGIGYMWDEVSAYPIETNPSEVTCDTIFQMFKQCTYFFEPTEINAYSREFSIYIKSKFDGGIDVDFNDMLGSDINTSGAGPLCWVVLLHALIKNADKFTEDADHVDWEYIEKGIHDKWSKLYLGKNIKGLDPKDSVLKTAQYILSHRAKKAIDRYNKILKTHEGEHKMINRPEWL